MRTFKNVQVIDDGGREVIQAVMTLKEITDMISTGEVKIGNPRPDHDQLPVGKKGTLRYRKTATRVKDWAEDLLKNQAVLGNLTWNFQPNTTYELDRGGDGALHLHVDGEGFATDIDSASRMRAIEMAAHATPSTMNPDTRVSVRIYPLEKSQETDKLFWIYNQIGEKVSNTVAKATYQGTNHQKLAKEFMIQSPHLGVDNVETKFDTVSKNSPKLVAFGTLSGAIESNWTADPFDDAAVAEQTGFLTKFWDALVHYRPELGRVPLSVRQAGRGTTLSATAVAMHGYIAVADAFYARGEEDFTRLADLNHRITMPAEGFRHRAGDGIDWLDYDNPEWQRRGVLVQSTDKKGVTKLTLRMSFQTRKAMGDAMLERLGMSVDS
jgi:hypothetical protein